MCIWKCVFVVSMALAVSVPPSFCQSAAVSSSHWSISGGLWRTDGGFTSTIQLKNRLVTRPISVTPELFMADGTEYVLPVINLRASGVATIDIKSALANAPAAVASHISGYGSAALTYNGTPFALMGQTAFGNLVLSESYMSRFTSVVSAPAGTQTLEGLWWARDAGVGGFVSLSNATGQPHSVTVQALSAAGQLQPPQSFTLTPQANRMQDLLSLIEHQPHGGDVGGLRIQYSGLLGEVNVNGGLENRQEGYSAAIPFWQAPMPGMNMSSPENTIAHPGIMVGAADPMMGFPATTRFTPYLALRNLTENIKQIRLVLYTEQGTALAAPAFLLEPLESRQVDLRKILSQFGLQENVDIKELISNQSRDEEGHMLPLNLREGSLVLQNAKDVHAPLSLNVNIGIFNVTKGTCYYGTVSCDGYWGNLIVSPASSSVAAAGEWVEDLSAYGQYTDGTTPWVSASWSSSNNSVATIDSGGNVVGVNAGNATMTATASLPQEGSYSGYNPSCASLQTNANFTGTASVAVGDMTPVISGISPSDWISGTTQSVTFSGQSFGSNAPTLSFSPPNGISYSLSSYSDTQIVANVNVAAGTPNENVTTTVTNNGYNGQRFQSNGNGQSSKGNATTSVHAPLNSPEITAVAWIDSNTISLPSGASSQLQSHLNNPVFCAADVTAWAVKVRRDLINAADPGYAAAFLLKHSANTPPPSTINAASYASGSNYRLINDFGAAKGGPSKTGLTPNPCSTFLANWTNVAGETNLITGSTGTSATGQIYKVSEGRVGTIGQAVNQTLTQHSTPWIWSVIEFNPAGGPYYQNHSIFPSFYFYTNGNFTTSYSPTAANAATFIGSDSSYQVSLPPNP